MSKDAKKPEQVERPIVPTGVMTEFGPAVEDPEQRRFSAGDDVDYTYTPGWSELRKQRDTELAEAAHGKRPPHKVLTLPGNVRLVRRATTSGAPDITKTVQHRNKGYRPVTKEDAGKSWFKELAASATVLPDGTIALGDCLYMYCPPEQAARNAAAKAQRTRDRIGAPEANAEQLGMATDRQPGEEIQLGTQISSAAVPRG